MQIYKRVRFTKKELQQLRQNFEDYIWAAVDPRKCVISIGDEYLADLRDVLLVRHCQPENIYGVGMDLKTGEINYVAQVNRRNPTVNPNGELSLESKENIKHTLHYFFEKLPIYNLTDEENKVEESSSTAAAFC